MMQQSRQEHGSSGELDVFGATSYFAGGGLPNNFFPGEPAAALLIQAANKVTRGTVMQDSFRAPPHVPDDDEQQGQLGVVVSKPSGGNKNKIAALLSFVVSPSPRASFRKESPPSPPSPPPAAKKLLLRAAGGAEPSNKVPSSSSSSSSSSRESSVVHLQGCGGVHDELDLGVATGDRRLQGVRVVRGRSGGEQERWVVRCSAWEEHHESMLVDDAAGSSSDPKDEVVDEEAGDDGNPAGGDDDWESDCSSDLFDLDLEYIC
jgi:hypothetical protein